MEAVCARAMAACETQLLAAALHCLHLYCSSISAALIYCCTKRQQTWYEKRWRCQNVRGVATIVVLVAWCCGAAAALARGVGGAALAASLLAPVAWLAAAALHLALWSRRSAAPLLYLTVYWLLVAAAAAAHLAQLLLAAPAPNHLQLYVQAITAIMGLVIAVVDAICFYDEVTKSSLNQQETAAKLSQNIPYIHNCTHFYSKISFFWMTALMYKGYESPLEKEDLGQLPEDERSNKHNRHIEKIYSNLKESKTKAPPGMWRCYCRFIWSNFYIAGVLKLCSDLIGLIPPLGLAVIIKFLENTNQQNTDTKSEITIQEFFGNGYVMLLVVTLALVLQAFLSQNSSHLVTVEGIRLKTALQGMVYNKCMKLAPWSYVEKENDEESPLLGSYEDQTTTQTGLVTNLLSQDTYNIMSCVWICHYTWAIPLKVAAILYLLYTKLGVSAIIGTSVSVLFITPLQFYLGKKLSDNSKAIAKCSDHRISKMSEILQGINVIKLYVWEDLFKEKILNLREVELKLLNKDSIYWGFLNFSTQVSTILISAITFTICYFLDYNEGFTAVNVFAGLALFNQLTIPLLVLPVTALMIIQAMVSTKRIEEFLQLPESNNVFENSVEDPKNKISDKLNEAFLDTKPEDDKDENDKDEALDAENGDQFSEDETLASSLEYVVRFRNAAFSWGNKSDTLLEVDDLDIPAGKLIMVVGSGGAGKSSLLSAVLGEMYLERGEVDFNGSAWYAGQPPWLVEGSVRDNVVMGGAWCPRRYARALRAAALHPDLRLLPEGDTSLLGGQGAPLSGGQRVRVCVARALYSRARLLALDEPLGALDAALARHVLARALLPAARAGRTVLLATNRLELLHHADLVIAMEDGRVSAFGRVGDPKLTAWAQRAAEARAAAARGGAGPPGGSARERSRLVRALSMAHQRNTEDTTVGISEPPGSHLLAEMPTCSGGSWRRRKVAPTIPQLSRQLSSPPPLKNYAKWRRDVRRSVSADASNTTLKREASMLRRLLQPRTERTFRWTRQTLQRVKRSDAESPAEDIPNGTIEDSDAETTYASLTSNGIEPASPMTDATSAKQVHDNSVSECAIWYEYGRASRWWGVAYWAAAALAQALAVAADCWLAYTVLEDGPQPPDGQQWQRIREYLWWGACGAAAAGAAGACGAGAGAAARRRLHDRLLHAALHAAPHAPRAHAMHRFSSDVHVVDKKLPTAISRWAQLALLCGAALLVNAVLAPWSLLALLPAFLLYLFLQEVYLRTARELQRSEAVSASLVLRRGAEACAGGGTVRAGRLLPRMRAAFLRRLDDTHSALLLINAANRWLGLALDLVGAAAVCATVGAALLCGGGPAIAGLAGTYSLLLPIYLSHLAKCRSDLHLQMAAVERIHVDTNVPQEDYRDDCAIPSGWERSGKIDFQNVNVQQDPGSPIILNNINFSVQPGEKIAICGRSGSGKSTLLLSCAGATTIQSGRVLVDGQDTGLVPLRALRHRMVLMPQDPVMFSGTLRENLDPLAVHTDEEIWQSLKAVGLSEFVSAQPAGLEWSVGGAGWRRGGRAGRACAARACLHAAPAAALLLDEPAAALDAAAEAALLRALARAAPHTTLLTVAHRISSIRSYDRAIVLEEGRIVEQGPVTALLAQPTSRLSRMLSATHRPA